MRRRRAVSEEDDPLAELAAELGSSSDDEEPPKRKLIKTRNYGVVFGAGKGIGNSRTEHTKKLAESMADLMQRIEIEPHLPEVAERRTQARAMLGQSGVHAEDFMTALDSQFRVLAEETVAIFEGFPTSEGQVEALTNAHGLPRFVIFLYDGATKLTEATDASAVVAAVGGPDQVIVVNATQAPEKIQKELRARFFAEQAQLPRPVQDIEGIEHVDELANRTGTPVSVMQWNVLADGLCANSPQSGGFGLCPAPWLTAEHRRSMVLKAISTRSPDIVALQETDNWEWWKLQMGKMGYQGCERLDHKSPCLKVAVNEPRFPDGLALFWKKGIFKLSERVVEEDPENTATEGKNKFLIARLRIKKTGEYVVVCNTHLDSRKSQEGHKVRLKQTRRMLASLEDTAVPTAWDTTGKTATAVFLCCDLNEVHGQDSHLEIRNREVLKATYRTKAGMRDVMRDSGSHTYAGYITSYKVRTGTYKHGTHKYAVDHMFHCGGAVPMAVARMPTEAQIGPRGLPAPNWPSDHMYVYCEYLICPTSGMPTSPHKVIKNPMAFGGELDEMRRSLVVDGTPDATTNPATESDKKLLCCICAVLFVLICVIGSVVADFW